MFHLSGLVEANSRQISAINLANHANPVDRNAIPDSLPHIENMRIESCGIALPAADLVVVDATIILGEVGDARVRGLEGTVGAASCVPIVFGCVSDIVKERKCQNGRDKGREQVVRR